MRFRRSRLIGPGLVMVVILSACGIRDSINESIGNSVVPVEDASGFERADLPDELVEYYEEWTTFTIPDEGTVVGWFVRSTRGSPDLVQVVLETTPEHAAELLEREDNPPRENLRFAYDGPTNERLDIALSRSPVTIAINQDFSTGASETTIGGDGDIITVLLEGQRV